MTPGSSGTVRDAIPASQVAPGVLFLASEECTLTGVVLAAAGGRFAVRHWARSSGVDFGRDPVEPEQIAERWAELADLH